MQTLKIIFVDFHNLAINTMAYNINPFTFINLHYIVMSICVITFGCIKQPHIMLQFTLIHTQVSMLVHGINLQVKFVVLNVSFFKESHFGRF